MKSGRDHLRRVPLSPEFLFSLPKGEATSQCFFLTVDLSRSLPGLVTAWLHFQIWEPPRGPQ